MNWAEGSPQLRLRANGKESELVAVPGMAFHYVSDDARRRCVGHKPFRSAGVEWVDCDRDPLRGSRTCDACTAVDATFASQLHHAHTRGAGEIDAAIRSHLEQPNHLYLAGFRDGTIKVGTSTARRLQTRLEEQGAWKASIVATATDGFAVRVLEDAVTTELGLGQSVSIGRKLAGLAAPMTNEHIDRELDRWTRSTHDLIASMADSRFTATSDRWETVSASDGRWDRVHPYPLRLDRGNHALELLTANGRAVMAQRPDGTDLFVSDIAQLFGLEITLLDDVLADEVTVQDSLF